MTKPPPPQPQNWSEADLPILTEIANDAASEQDDVEIPDFDFSAEIDKLRNELIAEPEQELEFPPELLFQGAESPPMPAGQAAALDFNRLPSLELDTEELSLEQVLPDSGTPASAGPEPVDTPQGLDALMARAMLDVPDQERQAMESKAREFYLNPSHTAAPDPAAVGEVRPGAPAVAKPDVQIPELTDLAEDDLSEAELETLLQARIPELTDLSENGWAEAGVDMPAGAEIPELTALADGEMINAALDAYADVSAPAQMDPGADMPARTSIPELTDLAGDEFDAPAEMRIPEWTDSAGDDVSETGADMPAQTSIPELTDLAGDEFDAPAEARIPEWTDQAGDDVSEMGSDIQEEPEIQALADLAAEAPEMPADVQLPILTDRAEDDASDTVSEIPEEIAIPELTDLAPGFESWPFPGATDPSDEAGSGPGAALPFDEPAPPSPDETESLAVPESPPAVAVPFQSFSVDSLPRGVLGGGLALVAAEQQPVLAPSMEELIRAAERTLAAELRQQELARGEDVPVPVAVAAEMPSAVNETGVEIAETCPPDVLDVSPGSGVQPASAAPESAPAGDRVMKIIHISGFAAPETPQPEPLPVRKSYVALFDESMMVDALYRTILPRMKSEMALWLQDALDSQVRQLLDGVALQLNEDFEMLFSETLRDSLRQAIDEMGQGNREERS